MHDVTAILVTRGDVNLERIVDTFPDDWEIIVWDNSREVVRRSLLRPSLDMRFPTPGDRKVAGRYAALEYATGNLIYVQDDDCIIDAESVVAAHEQGRLVANMPMSRWDDYPDSAMVGWGAVFSRLLAVTTFGTYRKRAGGRVVPADVFERCCDVIFSSLAPRTVIDIGFEHLPWAETPGRMFRQPGHKAERDAVLEQCRMLRTEPDDDRRYR